MLDWNVGYDPIVGAVGGPTFVDDLAGLTRGVRRTLRLHVFLLAAGHAAGLRIAAHDCMRLTALRAAPEAVAALEVLGVECMVSPRGLCFRGLPAHLVDCIGRSVAGPDWADGRGIWRGQCTCGVKTTLIPQQRLDVWRRTMRWSPFGPGAVARGGRYLGAWLEAVAAGALRGRLCWGREARARVAEGTWRKAITAIEDISTKLSASHASPAVRGRQWSD